MGWLVGLALREYHELKRAGSASAATLGNLTRLAAAGC